MAHREWKKVDARKPRRETKGTDAMDEQGEVTRQKRQEEKITSSGERFKNTDLNRRKLRSR